MDDIEGRRISEVNIRYTHPTNVDEARLRNVIGTRSGGSYSSEQVDNDIKKLYESGVVDDIRVLAEPMGSDLRVIFEVTPRPPMGLSGFVGNYYLSDQRLANEIRLRVGVEASHDEAAKAAQRLENYYRSLGYTKAHVEAVWNHESLVFHIKEGPRS